MTERHGNANVRILQSHRHIQRLWEHNRYWQTELLKNPKRSPSYEDDGLTAEQIANMPESLKMPSTRAGWNVIRRDADKSMHNRTKTVHHEKFWREIMGPDR